MQSLKKLPKKSRITGLYLYCNKCKAYYSSDSIANCKCNSMVYRAKIHITGTKKSSKVKTLIAENFEDAIKEFLEFKKSLINSNFNLNSQLIAVHKPVLLTECMAEYMAYLNNEGVPEHMKKTRTIGHLKDYERNFKYYIDALIENGEVVQTLKFLDINAIHVGYLHKYVLNNLNAKNRYYNNIISALRLFTSYIIKTYKYENIYSNHFQGVPRRFVNYDPKAVSGVEFYKLIGAVNKENGAKILKTGERKNYYRDWIVDAFWLGLFTGGRRDEVVYLKWSDIVYDENGQPLHFNSGDNKFNRSNSNIVSNEEKKIKQFQIYDDFKAFLDRVGYDKYKNSDNYVLAPETAYKRETMIDLISKAFTQFLSKTDIKVKLEFKNLRKTFSTSVRMQYGDHAHYITSHGGLSVMDKHYIDKSDVQKKMRKGFKIFENA